MTRRIGLPSGGDLRGYGWFLAAAAYVVIMAVSAAFLSWDIWAALVIAPALFTVTVPIVRRGLRRDADARMAKLVMVAFVAKMFGACARYALTFEVYEGRADAEGYHGSGARLAAAFWDGRLAEQMRFDAPELTGTPFINMVTGFFYAFTGPTKLGGFLIFAWLSFLGLFFFYKAAAIGFPEANLRRYAVLLFFMPTMLYWPSSLGKEAWICFALGLATYGVALILSHQPLGYPLAGLGLVGTAMPRPHITVLCFGSLMLAYMFRRKAWSDSTLGPVGKVVGVVVLLGAGGFAVSQAASFFELDEVSSSSVTSVLDRANRQSGQGGSEYTPTPVTSPVDLPQATMAVLFRPYPWEAGSAQALVSSLEGTVLLVLVVAGASRLARLPAFLFRVPYVAYCIAFTTMFVIAFSSIANFGIMTRQRSQVLPIFLVLLALPATRNEMADPAPTVEQRTRELALRPRPPGLR
jgi:hypothetical protein